MLFLCSPRICKDSRHKTGHNCCATIIDNIHENTQQHENNTVRQHKILHLHSRFPWHRKAASGKQDGQDDPGEASCTVSLALRLAFGTGNAQELTREPLHSLFGKAPLNDCHPLWQQRCRPEQGKRKERINALWADNQ